MKILIIEYITGGGLVKQALPASLVAEGEMMFNALVEDLLRIDDVELMVTRDYRLPLATAIASSLSLVTINSEQSLLTQLPSLFKQCHAVWPIAPETDNILFDLCHLIVQAPVILLASIPQTIAIATDKLATYQHLSAHHIAAVETHRLKDYNDDNRSTPSWVIKPRDGVGCVGVQSLSPAQLQSINHNEQELLLQPFCQGRVLSLSCLFAMGQGWLLCINQQLIRHQQNQFVLQACRVNIAVAQQPYQQLVTDIATAMPGLWGYIGIDLIETEAGPLILEINPRLTTSYTGIKAALGINVAALVLSLLEATPEINRLRNQSVLINIA